MAKIIVLNENQYGEMMAYHGTGADFDKFNHKKYLSSGAGSQCFGWGTYVTDDRAIAKGYSDAAVRNGYISEFITCKEKGYKYREMMGPLFLEAFRRKYLRGFKMCGLDESSAIKGCSYLWRQLYVNRFKKAETYRSVKIDLTNSMMRRPPMLNKQPLGRFPKAPGNKPDSKIIEASLKVLNDMEVYNEGKKMLYEVDIPDDNGQNYLSWHEAISEENASRILYYLLHFQKRFKYDIDETFKERLNDCRIIGGQVYFCLQRCFKSKKAASLFLMQCGFDGIKYMAGTIWRKPNGAASNAMNYVIFDANKVKIVNKAAV